MGGGAGALSSSVSPPAHLNGIFGDGVGGKNSVFLIFVICWPHVGIEGALTRQKCAEKWCATLWAPGLQFSVSSNSQILNVHDFQEIEFSMY